jgi:KUP system potassium uptake protein
VWVLVLIVSVKYVAFILRADNRGEGGVLALLALILQRQHREGRETASRAADRARGCSAARFCTAMARSRPPFQCSAQSKDWRSPSPALARIVIPIAFIIVALLFWFQRYGTARIGGLFGWIMAAWFVTIAALGIRGIIARPDILFALNPWHAVQFFVAHPQLSFVALGRRGSRRHRRRGVVRRHGALRAEADPTRLVLVRAARRCC